MSAPQPRDLGAESEDELAVRPAVGGIYAAGDAETEHFTVPRHTVIIVCQTSLRRRTRWHMAVVRRKADVLPCPRCARKAYIEVVEHTDLSAHWEWPEASDDGR